MAETLKSAHLLLSHLASEGPKPEVIYIILPNIFVTLSHKRFGTIEKMFKVRMKSRVSILKCKHIWDFYIIIILLSKWVLYPTGLPVSGLSSCHAGVNTAADIKFPLMAEEISCLSALFPWGIMLEVITLSNKLFFLMGYGERGPEDWRGPVFHWTKWFCSEVKVCMTQSRGWYARSHALI